LLLQRSQNLVAPFCVLQVLLIVVKPKGRVNTDKIEDQLCGPATNTREKRTLLVYNGHEYHGGLETAVPCLLIAQQSTISKLGSPETLNGKIRVT
jgi:hypothetical protein